MTIEIKRVSGIELYHRYPRQTQRQPCHVELDARGDGVLSAAFNAEIESGAPGDVHFCHRIRWGIPALRADAANALLDAIAPLAERVVAGYTSRWNGDVHVGSYTTDAEDACAEIEVLCSRAGGDGDEVCVVDAGDHLAALGSSAVQARELGITGETTDEELDQIEERELAAARDAGAVDLIEGLDRHLRALRDRLSDEAA